MFSFCLLPLPFPRPPPISPSVRWGFSEDAATTKRRGTERSDAAAKCAAYPRRYFPSVEIGQRKLTAYEPRVEKNIGVYPRAMIRRLSRLRASVSMRAREARGKAVIKAASSCSSTLVYSARDLFTRTRAFRRDRV